MTDTAQAASVISSRQAVEQCLAFVQRSVGRRFQAQPDSQVDRRSSPRLAFTHQVRLCPHATLTEGHARPAQTLDISLGGVGLLCFDAIRKGAIIHVYLPVLDGQGAWVRGKVAYCRPHGVHYRAGIAFLFD